MALSPTLLDVEVCGIVSLHHLFSLEENDNIFRLESVLQIVNLILYVFLRFLLLIRFSLFHYATSSCLVAMETPHTLWLFCNFPQNDTQLCVAPTPVNSLLTHYNKHKCAHTHTHTHRATKKPNPKSVCNQTTNWQINLAWRENGDTCCSFSISAGIQEMNILQRNPSTTLLPPIV